MPRFYKPFLLLLSIFTVQLLEAQTARLQVIHNAADALAQEVDIYVNDALFLDDFAFRTATPFVDVPAGVDLVIGVAPGTSTSADDVIAEFTVNLTENETYIAIANGLLDAGSYDPFQPFTISVFPAAREQAANGDFTDVLVYHGATDAPTVDVTESLVTGGATIVDDLTYNTFAGYLELPTDDYRLEVRDETGAVVVKSYEAPLEALSLQGAALTVLASGFLNPANNNGGPAFGLYVALPTGGDLIALPESSARLQVIHNAADALAAEVDVYLNDGLLLDDFAFRTATPFVDVPAGVEISISIAPGNSTSVNDALATYTYTLAPGETYVIIASGLLDAASYDPFVPFDLSVFPAGRETASQAGNTDVLVFHGATDAPTVDVVETAVTGGVTVVDDAAYGDFAGYLELGTADYRLEVRDETGAVTVASYEAPLATLGLQDQALAVLASGFLNPAVNNDGPAFGLYVALPAGGDLVELPLSTARVQVVHNSADALAAEVDVYLNGSLLLDDFAYRTATPFVDLPAVTDVVVGIAPGNSTSADDVLANFTYNLTPGESYLIVATGLLDNTSYDPFQPFDLAEYPGAREGASQTGNTDVLVYHGATDAPTVDVVETLVTGGLTIVDNASYGDFAGYLELGTADYRIDVRDETGAVTVATYDAPLAGLGLEDQALAVLASGFLNPAANNDGPGFGLFAVLPTGGDLIPLPLYTPTARVQVIHNSPDQIAGSVDVYLNDELLIDNFAFRTATPFVDVPANVPVTLGVAPPTSTSVEDVLADFTYTLDDGMTYVIVADGLVSPFGYNPFVALTLEVYDMGREQASEAGQTDVLIHHGSTDAPTVDIVETLVTGGAVLVDDLDYAEFAGYLELPTADYIVDVRDQTGQTSVAAYQAPLATLALEDQALVVIASGFLNPAANLDGPAFGLYVALPAGGDLIALPLSTTSTNVLPEGAEISFFPNPVRDELTIQTKNLDVRQVRLNDLAGRDIPVRYTQGGDTLLLDVNTLPTGAYMLTVSGPDFRVHEKIFIVE